jgi:hypothetical protein
MLSTLMFVRCVWISQDFLSLNRQSTQWVARLFPNVTMAIYRLEILHCAVKILVNIVSFWVLNYNETLFKMISVYVPINPRQPNERQLRITIVSNGNSRQDWNIAVHQLDCPFGQSRIQNFVQAASEIEKVAVNRQPRTFFSDWLAPPGCLQYHVNPNGIMETFNFNNGAGENWLCGLKTEFFLNVLIFSGPYIGDMKYAICFRRVRGNSALQ